MSQLKAKKEKECSISIHSFTKVVSWVLMLPSARWPATYLRA